MADFARRGFRLNRPNSRACLEAHARSFLTGFNLAAAHRKELHDALSSVPEQERGFAYEGAGMYTMLVDLSTCGVTGAMRRLLAGPGRRYVHLVHVGAGWGLAATRLPVRVPLPSTPLLRWLALDGAGFAETYFGGLRALGRRCARMPAAWWVGAGGKAADRMAAGGTAASRLAAGRLEQWEARVSGCGRAMWFVESADPSGLTSRITEQPAAARPWLWSGVGLAAGYAGATTADELRGLGHAAGSAWPYFAQGMAFAVAARVLSGVVPAHTALASRTVLGVDPHVAASWSDVAADGLTDRKDVHGYAQWRHRLRMIVTELGRCG